MLAAVLLVLNELVFELLLQGCVLVVSLRIGTLVDSDMFGLFMFDVLAALQTRIKFIAVISLNRFSTL